MEDPIGNDLIAAILNDNKLPEIKVEESDLNFSARDAFKFINGYLTEYGSFPPEKLVVEEVGIQLPLMFPDANATAERIRRRTLSKRISDQINRAVDALEEGDPDKSLVFLDALKEEKSRVRSVPVSFRESGDLRYQAYLESQKQQGLDGFRTPWPTLNKSILGFNRGEFHCIAAYFGTGKTYVSCILANDMLNQGARTLLVTMEMPSHRVMRRIDSIRNKIPFSLMRRAELGEALEDAWKQNLIADKVGDGDILVADKKIVRNVMDIRDLCNDYQADAVIIDGGYRLEGRRNRNRWESGAEVIEDIQLSAEATRAPWVVTTQMGDSNEVKGKSGKGGPRAWGVRYNKEWLIEPDGVFILNQTEAERELGVMNIYIEKVREGVPEGLENPYFTINWDMVKMDFTEISEEDEGDDGGMLEF